MDDVVIQQLSSSLKKLPLRKQQMYINFLKSGKLSEEGKNKEADQVFDVCNMNRDDIHYLMYTLGEIYLNTLSTSKLLDALQK
jgi:hypothetical protein